MIIAAEWMESWGHLCVVLIITVVSVLIAVAIGFLVRSRLPKASHVWKETVEKQIRWPFHVMGFAFFVLCAAGLWYDESPAIALYFGCFALMQLVVTVWSVRRHRSQWSIKTLLLITLIVAIACSLIGWQGLPMVGVLIAVTGGGIVLLFLSALLRSCLIRPLDPPEDDHEGSPE